MAEYIDRGALIEWLKRMRLIALSDGRGLCRVIMEDDFKKAIKKMPKDIIADVSPVRHAKWSVNVGMNFFKERNCPVCKKRIESNFWNYCPNCGAKMDLEDGEDNNANKKID